MEILCKVLEMECKMYTSVGLKFLFEKIKSKVLHYVQHDFIRQRPGLSKDQHVQKPFYELFHPQILSHILMVV